MALQVRLCARFSRKAESRYFAFFIDEGDSDFGILQSIRVTNRADIRLFAAEDAISLEYDDRVLLSFIPDNPDLIPGLPGFGEYIRDTATVNINDSDSKRCS